ncbi:MAG: tetratricopeptide repeat protein, partial [Bryobacteraceae bacterium]
ALGIAGLGLPYLPSNVPASKRALVELAGSALWSLYAQREDEVKALFPKLVAEYPKEPGVHYLDGISLVADRPDAARVQFEEELKVNPSNASARIQIAMLDIMAGNSSHAIPLAREALRLEPRNPLAHEVLGRAYMDTDQLPRAVPELEAAAKFAPNNPQTHFYLERGYRRVGRLADAKKQRAEFDRLRAAEQPTVYSDQMTTSRKGAVSGVFR